MNDKIEFTKKGHWYLPMYQDKILGSINYSSDLGCSLEIFGSLKPINLLSREREVEIILGETLEGELITLFDCFLISQTSFPQTNNASEKYYCNFVLLGNHYLNNSEIVFDNILCKIPNLIHWVGISGFNDLQFDNYKSFDINYKKPENIIVKIDEDKNLTFKFNQSYYWKNIFDRTVEQDVSLLFSSNKPIQFKLWLSKIYSFCYFLSAVYFRYTSPIIFKVTASNQKQLFIYSKVFLSADEISDKDFRMFFNYNSISNECFSSLVQTLYRDENLLEPILFMLGVSFKHTSIIPEVYFLTMSQAIETFHRRLIGGSINSNEDWLKIKEEILNATPEKYQKLVTEALQYKNEHSFRTRLNYLINILPNEILEIFHLDKKSERNKFINEVVTTRNYYTHYDTKNKPSLDNEGLITLAYKIRGILMYVFFHHLGFNGDDLIKVFLTNKDRFYFL